MVLELIRFDVIRPRRSILDMVYDGDAPMRSKYVAMLAAEIRPRMDAPLYLDKSVYENELKQARAAGGWLADSLIDLLMSELVRGVKWL